MLQGPNLGLELIRGLGLDLQSDCGWVFGMLGRKGLPYMYFVLYGRHIMEKLIFKKRCVHTHVTYLYMVDFHSRVGLLEGTLCKRPCQFSKKALCCFQCILKPKWVSLLKPTKGLFANQNSKHMIV